jgi:predicted RNA-binding protein with PUA-like domain
MNREIEELFIKHNEGCVCNEIYKSRQLKDPECMFHNVDFETPMEEYAALRTLELEKELEKVKGLLETMYRVSCSQRTSEKTNAAWQLFKQNNSL